MNVTNGSTGKAVEPFAIWYHTVMQIDVMLVSFFNGLAGQSSALDSLIVFFAQYFPYLLAFVFLLSVLRSSYVLKEKWMLLLQGIAAAVLARGAVELIRIFIHRPRPFLDTTVTALLSEGSFSFPSGHAAFFFALSTVVYLFNKRWGVWFYIASTVIGLARVAAGMHYLSDILAGALLGLAVGWSIVRITDTFRFPKVTGKEVDHMQK